MTQALASPVGILFLVAAFLVTIICIPLALLPAPEIELPIEIRYASQIAIDANAKAEWAMVVGDAEVNTDDPHSGIKHGIADVETVRAAMKIKAAENDIWWNRDPCRGSNRYRYVLQLADGNWAVWVLDRIADKVLKEVTAFITNDQGYVQKVDKDCNEHWLGPVYGG